MIVFILVMIAVFCSICVAVHRYLVDNRRYERLYKENGNSVEIPLDDAEIYAKWLQIQAHKALQDCDGRVDVGEFDKSYYDKFVPSRCIVPYIRFLMKVDSRVLLVKGKHYHKVLKYIEDLEENSTE